MQHSPFYSCPNGWIQSIDCNKDDCYSLEKVAKRYVRHEENADGIHEYRYIKERWYNIICECPFCFTKYYFHANQKTLDALLKIIKAVRL